MQEESSGEMQYYLFERRYDSGVFGQAMLFWFMAEKNFTSSRPQLLVRIGMELTVQNLAIFDARSHMNERLRVTCCLTYEAATLNVSALAMLKAVLTLLDPFLCLTTFVACHRQHQHATKYHLHLTIMAQPSNEEPTAAKTGFFDLPPELREEVYR